jgi:hypothetical protein
MQDSTATPGMIIGERWIGAPDTVPICLGECAGRVKYVAGGDDLKAIAADAAQNGEKRIYVCDATASALRVLIPSALGFVFGQGSTLGHFASVLRYDRLPACISRRLWAGAKDAMAGNGPARGELRFGRAVTPGPEARVRYEADLERYRDRLRDHRAVVPVYDAGRGAVRSPGERLAPEIGEKALAVNALLAEGCPAANAVFLTGLDAACGWLTEDAAFRSLLEARFPRFGKDGGALMVRGSLHSDDGSHAAWSGLIKSPSVTTLPELERVVAESVSQYKRLCEQLSPVTLAIILQERIAAPIHGTLCTGQPWCCSSEGMVAELTLEPAETETRNPVWLPDMDTAEQGALFSEKIDRLRDSDPRLAGKDLRGALDRVGCQARALQERYGAPLDIEFVIADDMRFYFVQFRPLLRFPVAAHPGRSIARVLQKT